MNKRKISAALAILLIISMVLSGTLLILLAEHECHDVICHTCLEIARRVEMLLGSIALLIAVGMFTAESCDHIFGPPEDRYVPDWTPVRRKVKLLN